MWITPPEKNKQFLALNLHDVIASEHFEKRLFIQSSNCEREHCDFPRDFPREPSFILKVAIRAEWRSRIDK
jgi:hypothetical protein